MPCLLSRAIWTCPWCCIKAHIFNIYYTHTYFSDHLQLNFPQLKHCGGFQLLRSRGSTRSKVLKIIPCSQDGYTPELLCNKELGVGAAVIYIRPLQKDIDLEVIICLQCSIWFFRVLARKFPARNPHNGNMSEQNPPSFVVKIFDSLLHINVIIVSRLC